MTEPKGRSFLCYRRSRIHEARLLIAHQHDLGIPTWQDISNLDEDPTEEAIRAVLADPTTANAVMWLTPEVQDSAMIRRVEAPLIIDRFRKRDGFFVVPVAAGGLDYDTAAGVVDECIGTEDLRNWNVRKVSSDPATEEQIREVAVRILMRRMEAVHRHLQSSEPLKLVLNTRVAPPFSTDNALAVDWTHRFEGRIAPHDTWSSYLLPALAHIADSIQQKAPGRSVLATGLLSIPAAAALGFSFIAPRRVDIAWEQFTPGRPSQTWTLNEVPKESGFEVIETPGSINSNHLALLVSVNADVSHAIDRTRESLPKFRAYIHIKHQEKKGSVEIGSPREAIHITRLVINAARTAREQYRTDGRIHLFMAVPVGLAMLIGQLLNTLGQVQTYEHIPENTMGYYVPAALLGG